MAVLLAIILSVIWCFNCMNLSYFTSKPQNDHIIPEKLNQSTSSGNFNDQTLNYYPLTVTVCQMQNKRHTHTQIHSVKHIYSTKDENENKPEIELPFKRKQINDGGDNDGQQNHNNNHSCKQ